MKRHISLQLRGVGQFVANYQECTIAPGTTGRNGNSSADEIRKAVLQSCKLAIAFFAADCPLIYEKPRSDTRMYDRLRYGHVEAYKQSTRLT
jgi:hypothetical protein